MAPGAQTEATETLEVVKVTLSIVPPTTLLTVAVKVILPPILVESDTGARFTVQDLDGSGVGVLVRVGVRAARVGVLVLVGVGGTGVLVLVGVGGTGVLVLVGVEVRTLPHCLVIDWSTRTFPVAEYIMPRIV